MEAPVYRCGNFRVDAANRKFSCGNTQISLEPRILAVILQLVSRPGALVTRVELLDAIWGHRYVSPSTLSRVIALARRAFNDDPDDPRYIETVHGAGYRYIGPAEPENAARPDAPVRFAPPPSARPPTRIGALIGRQIELDALTEALARHRAVTLLGTGGIGKTQCALEWARRYSSNFLDGIWFFDLAPMKTGADWLRALAAVLAIPSAAAAELLPRILPLLQGRNTLLLIDNCDRIAEDVGALVVEVLRNTDTLRMLATSQVPLNFLGEQLMRIPPLALPGRSEGETPALRAVAAAPAVELLLTRIRAVQPAFELTESNVGSIVGICRQLDGMPLALEFAAARFALLSPQQVLERLTQRFRFLRSEVAGRDIRHRNLLILLEWSFSLLSPEEQRLLCWLSVFVRGWTVEAAIALGTPLRCDPETIVELLTGLVNKSLVSVDPGIEPPRYRLLETVREYASERLRARDEEKQARDAHLAVMAQLSKAAHADMVGGHMRKRVAQLIHEDGNIAGALEYALESGHGRSSTLAILGFLTLYFKARGNYDAGRRWCRRALLQAQSPCNVERARALLCHGVLSVHLTEGKHEAEPVLLEAIHLAQREGDCWIEAYASGYYALWLSNWGRADEAGAFAEVTQRTAVELKDSLLAGLAALSRGWVHIANGNCGEAIEVLRSVPESDDLHQQHFTDMYVGLALFQLEDYRAAARQWSQAMRGAAAVANMRGVAGSIEGCAYIAEKFGQAVEAARLLAAARRIREQTGVPLFNFWLIHHDAAEKRLVSLLGKEEYRLCAAAGEKTRAEDAVDEARHLLENFSRHSRDPLPADGA